MASVDTDYGFPLITASCGRGSFVMREWGEGNFFLVPSFDKTLTLTITTEYPSEDTKQLVYQRDEGYEAVRSRYGLPILFEVMCLFRQHDKELFSVMSDVERMEEEILNG